MARPEDHYLSVFKRGEEGPKLVQFDTESGWTVIDDPENPPHGMHLPEAVERASLARERLDREKTDQHVIVTWRQSDGGYFPVALVESKSIFILFDPGLPRLQLSREGRQHLRKIGLKI